MDATYNPICYISFFRRQMFIGFVAAYIIIYIIRQALPNSN